MGTWIYEVWGEGASVRERKGDGGRIRLRGGRIVEEGQLLRSWQAKRRGGFLHQSKNPRCSELRKSFRISQRIAPVPVFLLARALEAAPPELGVRPAAVLRNPPYPAGSP